MPRPKKIAAFTPYFTEEEAGQVRAAFLVAKEHEDVASASDFIVRATMKEVKRVQRKYNGGRQFDPVDPGGLRRGQRTLDELKPKKEDS
jgi:hypothetical protein